jgi:Plasmid replication region DNA-binding N-term.
MAITKDDVFAIADRLDAEGRNPTLASIRRELGSGSFTTISEFMRDWKQQRANKALVKHEIPVPDEVAAAASTLASAVWGAAIAAASALHNQERDSFEKSRADWNAERADLTALADSLTGDLEEVRGQFDEITATVAALEGEKRQLGAELDRLGTEAAVAVARAKELEGRVQDLNAELERVNKLNSDLMDGFKKLAPAAT